LSEIEKQESEKPGFKLVDYLPTDKTAKETPVITKKWWNFWN
jgi:hypothetical protein